MTSSPCLRVLTIALRECAPALEPAVFAALPGIEWIGDAADCNEGLRQILMVRPDAIAMPWSAAALKLLRALTHYRSRHPVPVAMMVAPERLPHPLPARDGVITVGIDELNASLADRLRRLLSEQSGAPRIELLLKPSERSNGHVR